MSIFLYFSELWVNHWIWYLSDIPEDSDLDLEYCDRCQWQSKMSDPDKHAGGPLERTGEPPAHWKEAVGPSFDVIPTAQLPLVRTILQRYRAVRILRPIEPVSAIASSLTEEILPICERANIPTVSVKVCRRCVQDAIKLYNTKHKHCDRMEDSFQTKLNELLDLATKSADRKGPNTSDKDTKELKKLMKVKTGGQKRKAGAKKDPCEEWEQDFNFYLDQPGEWKQQIRSLDQKYSVRQKKWQERKEHEKSLDEALNII